MNSPSTARRAGPCSGASMEISDGFSGVSCAEPAAGRVREVRVQPVGGEARVGRARRGCRRAGTRPTPPGRPAASPWSSGRARSIDSTPSNGQARGGKVSCEVIGVPPRDTSSIRKKLVHLSSTVATRKQSVHLREEWDNPRMSTPDWTAAAGGRAPQPRPDPGRGAGDLRRAGRRGADGGDRAPRLGRRRHALPAVRRPGGADPRRVPGQLRRPSPRRPAPRSRRSRPAWDALVRIMRLSERLRLSMSMHAKSPLVSARSCGRTRRPSGCARNCSTCSTRRCAGRRTRARCGATSASATSR